MNFNLAKTLGCSRYNNLELLGIIQYTGNVYLGLVFNFSFIILAS